MYKYIDKYMNTHIKVKITEHNLVAVINYMIICNTRQYRLQMVFVTVFALFTFSFAFCGVSLKCILSTQSDARVNMDSCVCWSNTSFQPHCPALRCYLLISDHHYTSPQTLQTSHQTRPLLQIVCIIFRFIHSVLGVQQTAAGVCIVGYGTGYWSWLCWRNKFI